MDLLSQTISSDELRLYELTTSLMAMCGIPTGLEIRYARKSLGLRKEDLGTPDVIDSWEGGSAPFPEEVRLKMLHLLRTQLKVVAHSYEDYESDNRPTLPSLSSAELGEEVHIPSEDFSRPTLISGSPLVTRDWPQWGFFFSCGALALSTMATVLVISMWYRLLSAR